MTYIPNVREKYVEHPYSSLREQKGLPEKEENFYWEGNIEKEEHKHFMRGYDCASKESDTFFDNIDNYRNDIIEKSGLLMPQENFNKLAEAFRKSMADWMENDRNLMVVSIIDEETCEKDDAEYQKALAKNTDKNEELDLYEEIEDQLCDILDKHGIRATLYQEKVGAEYCSMNTFICDEDFDEDMDSVQFNALSNIIRDFIDREDRTKWITRIQNILSYLIVDTAIDRDDKEDEDTEEK